MKRKICGKRTKLRVIVNMITRIYKVVYYFINDKYYKTLQ